MKLKELLSVMDEVTIDKADIYIKNYPDTPLDSKDYEKHSYLEVREITTDNYGMCIECFDDDRLIMEEEKQ